MSHIRYEKCGVCRKVIATQMGDGEIKRYDDDHKDCETSE